MHRDIRFGFDTPRNARAYPNRMVWISKLNSFRWNAETNSRISNETALFVWGHQCGASLVVLTIQRAHYIQLNGVKVGAGTPSKTIDQKPLDLSPKRIMAAFNVERGWNKTKTKIVIVIAMANAQNRILAINVLAIRTHSAHMQLQETEEHCSNK